MLNYQTSVIRPAAILAGSYVAGTILEEVQEHNQLILLVDFIKGSLTTAEIKVEFSFDGTNYYQETFQSISGGIATETVAEHQILLTGAYRILIPIKDRFIKVSAKGTGTATDSSMDIKAVVAEV